MFSKETEYALRSMVYVQTQNYKGNRPGVAEIAREIEAPQYYIAKILQRMVHMGFLMSQKGRGGGFFFDETKPDLTIKEVLAVTEGYHLLTDCGLGLKHCNESAPCPLHEKYAPLRRVIENLVVIETIQTLAQRVIT